MTWFRGKVLTSFFMTCDVYFFVQSVCHAPWNRNSARHITLHLPCHCHFHCHSYSQGGYSFVTASVVSRVNAMLQFLTRNKMTTKAEERLDK